MHYVYLYEIKPVSAMKRNVLSGIGDTERFGEVPLRASDNVFYTVTHHVVLLLMDLDIHYEP